MLVDRLQKTTTKVAKTPNLFLGIAHMISMLTQHTGPMVKFDPTLSMIKYEMLVSHITQAMLADVGEVRKTLEMMETLGLIEHQILNEMRYINVLGKDDFLDRCSRIQVTLEKMAAGNA